MKSTYVTVKILYGFAAGRTCRAQKIFDHGYTWYHTSIPGCGQIDYPPHMVKELD